MRPTPGHFRAKSEKGQHVGTVMCDFCQLSAWCQSRLSLPAGQTVTSSVTKVNSDKNCASELRYAILHSPVYQLKMKQMGI